MCKYEHVCVCIWEQTIFKWKAYRILRYPPYSVGMLVYYYFWAFSSSTYSHFDKINVLEKCNFCVSQLHHKEFRNAPNASIQLSWVELAVAGAAAATDMPLSLYVCGILIIPLTLMSILYLNIRIYFGILPLMLRFCSYYMISSNGECHSQKVILF